VRQQLIYRTAGHHVAGEKDDRHGGSASAGLGEVGHRVDIRLVDE
jgi:hypothetical protein